MNNICPICYSRRTKVRKVNGVPELCCHDCGYDSADKNREAHQAHHKRDEREPAPRGKGGHNAMAR